MKRKIVAALCVVAMGAMMAMGCGSSSSQAPAEEQSAEAPAEQEAAAPEAAAAEAEAPEAEAGSAERTSLTVGFDAEFPPYGYKNEAGEYVGFDLDMARAVCEKNGWEFVAQPIDWDAKDMELSSGAIDCIWNGFTINGREDAYTWSVPYIDNSQVFVVAADSDVAAKADLAGKIVGVQKDSSALAALNDEENADLLNSFSSLTEYSDYNIAFMDLEAGAIDAVALDIGVANYQLAQKADAFKMLDETLSTEQYGIGFLLGNDDLKNTVEASMLELFKDGTMEKIAGEYGIDTSMICLK